MKRIVVLILIMSLLVTICACNGQTTTISVATADPEPTSAVSPSPSPTPASEPKPTELLLPDPVVVPREDFPDGQLFAKEYYAVLPGEGAYYNIFDCYGTLLDSFFFNNAEIDPPIGLLTSDELAKYYRLNWADVRTVVPEEMGFGYTSNLLTSYANGFYQKPYEYEQNTSDHCHVYLYNRKGKLIATLTESIVNKNFSPLITVAAVYSGETVVAFQQSNGKYWRVSIYFIAENGKINNKCTIDNLPGQPYGLLARKYFLSSVASSGYSICNVYDFSGKLVMADVSTLENDRLRLLMPEGMMNIQINDFILKDGVTLDASLQPVPGNQTEANGSLIYGVEYLVSGIPCQASLFDQSQELVAIGTANGQIVIKTKTNEYLLVGKDLEYLGMNNHLAAFQNAADAKKIYSLASGQMIHLLDADLNIKMADNYLLARNHYEIGGLNRPNSTGFGIIDNSGNVRYSSTNSYAETTHGDCIVLYRGPYVGIADLNGEWILKSFKWELTRDQDYVYPWE